MSPKIALIVKDFNNKKYEEEMSDWRFKFDMIKNKVKSQLHARGVDNLVGIVQYFNVLLVFVIRLGVRS